MPLPKIETPKYDTKLPLSGMKVKYRPYLVREHKVLLQAIEMGDSTQVTNAVEDILKACTFGEIDIYDLPVADVEFMVLKIREKSVGEVIDMVYKCNNDVENDGKTESCNTKIPIQVNVSGVGVEKPEVKEKIMLTETIGVTLHHVKYGAWKEASEHQNQVDREDALILACIDSVFDEDQVYSRNDFTDDELSVFLGGLENTDFEEIREYAKKVPIVSMDIPVGCGKCKYKEVITLRGLKDFLV